MQIEVIDLQDAPVDISLLRRAVATAARTAPHSGTHVSVALVDDGRITDLNRAHRDRDGATDVLAYEADDGDSAYLGDVVISVETAARQAEEAGRPVAHEVAWLAAHGVLHLIGFDDGCEPDRIRMIDLQDEILYHALAEEDTHTL
jgi:probable rRNA maturation factor